MNMLQMVTTNMILISLVSLIAAIVFYRLGKTAGMKRRQKEALKYGYAQYNNKTGAWEWIEPRTKLEIVGEPIVSPPPTIASGPSFDA